MHGSKKFAPPRGSRINRSVLEQDQWNRYSMDPGTEAKLSGSSAFAAAGSMSSNFSRMTSIESGFGGVEH